MKEKQKNRPRPHHKTTLADVAARVGVSSMTVSRALSQPGKVKPKTLEKILVAVEELGFVPNHMASALAANQSRIIGLSVPSLSNQVFIDVVSAVQDFFLPKGYQVIIHTYHYSGAQEYEGVQMFMRLQVDAVILIGVDQLMETRKMLEQSGVGVVQLMDITATPLNINIGFSQYHAGRAIAEHLFDTGASKLAFIGARMDSRTLRRLSGFKDVCIEREAWYPALCVTTADKSSLVQGRVLLKKLIAKDEPFDSIFCCNDDLALGVIFECTRANISIPSQFKLVGFNNLEFAQESVPTLTTMGTSRYDMATKGCQVLYEQMEIGVKQELSIEWPMKLYARETTM
ncbi:LacI family DNA-binding transcriptional regulator [Reinekea sp.]|uniref:LacI family DNA-binding transcriptional regulator n=1 Tax=Reinekea sp. TaxID=1970455 RepID=UPI0039892164